MKHTGLVLLYTGRQVATIEVLSHQSNGAKWPKTAAEGPLSKALTPD